MGDYEPDDPPWTEDQWERFMQRSDARSARFGELLETLIDHPDREEIIAREMGWDHMLEDRDRDELDDLDASVTDDEERKFALGEAIKEELPELAKHEKEYAELLANGVAEEEIPESEAEIIVAELVEATTNAEQSGETPQEVLRLLHEIKAKLESPGRSAAAKLKVALPIIPAVAKYELQLDTENLVANVWNKARRLFERQVDQSPQ